MRSYTNPVYDGYFADPFAWEHQGQYYAVGTGPLEAEGEAERVGDRLFPLLCTDDFVTWRPAGRALSRPAGESGDAFWAPEVAYEGGQFYLYYSAGHDDKNHRLRVATSDRPEGPYVDTGTPLTELSACPFAIDPHPFRDDDGRWYLFHSRDFLEIEDGGRIGTGIVVDRLEGMTRL